MFSRLVVGGGCFWCVEAYLQRLKGVKKVESGYAGGFMKNPTYQAVCQGTTGHAEVVRVLFDPAEISYQSKWRYYFRHSLHLHAFARPYYPQSSR